MRVGFDGRDLLRKRTGVVNYTVYLARHLRRQPDAELLVYADTHVDPRVQPPPDVPLRRLAAPPVLWKHVALPVALARDRANLFHSPTGTLPLVSPCPQVVTIHDLFAVIGPHWFPGGTAHRLAAAQQRSAGAARAIVTVSESTRQDVITSFRVPPDKVHVVHNGIDHDRFHPLVVDGPAVAARYGVPYPFVLCTGSLMPWRNAPGLLRACAQLNCGLLFVGRDIWGSDPTEAIAREKGWSWARFTGYLADDELPALYTAAAAFAYPSLYEGFGIPPLEAMACGTPVVASNRGALPEVLGDAALLVDPDDEDALADALRQAIDHPVDLCERGLQRAARFRWDTAAAATWRVYRSVGVDV